MEQQQLVWTRQLYYTVVEIVKTKKNVVCYVYGIYLEQQQLSIIYRSYHHTISLTKKKKSQINMQFMSCTSF